jgi:hypothetical protein
MANTLGTTNGALVLQRTMSTLFQRFPVLKQLTTDFSDKSVKKGQQVNSRVIVPSAAIVHNEATGYAAVDMTAVDVPVTIDTWIEHTYTVTDGERSSTDRDLIQEFADAQANAIGTKIVGDIFAKVTVANFGLSYAVSPANFDRDDVVKIRTKLQKANVPDTNRFMCLNSDYAEGLGIDQTIVGGINNPGVTTLRDGQLPMIHNFNVSEFSGMPDNGEKLAGIAGNKEAIVLAARVPEVPTNSADIMVPGVIKLVTEPFSGMTVQYRAYYDMKLGQEFRTLTLMYGIASGLSGAGANNRLVRITNV